MDKYKHHRMMKWEIDSHKNFCRYNKNTHYFLDVFAGVITWAYNLSINHTINTVKEKHSYNFNDFNNKIRFASKTKEYGANFEGPFEFRKKNDE